MFREDPEMPKFFSVAEIEIIAEAIEDHRSHREYTLAEEPGAEISPAILI